MTKAQHFFYLSIVFTCATAYLINDLRLTWPDSSVALKCSKTFLLMTLTSISAMCLNISQRHPADACGYSQCIKLWLLSNVLAVISKFANIKKHKNNFSEQQKEFLLYCLQSNSQTSYSKEAGLDKIKTVEGFRSSHPLVNYDHYEAFVDRCKKGEQNVMCKHPIDFFAWTSGTSGKNKTYPYNWKLFGRLGGGGNIVSQDALKKAFKSTYWLRPMFLPIVTHRMERTENGIECGTIGAKSMMGMPEFLAVTPSAVNEIHTEDVALYVHALFGLHFRDIGTLNLLLAPNAHSFFTMLEKNWPALCDDIEHGSIADDILLSDEIRCKLLLSLKPSPARAAELRTQFSKGFKAIAHRIWPEVEWAICITTGSFSTYRKSLDYYLEGITVVTNAHGATEGSFGINIDPKNTEVKFLLNPFGHFYEFIPEDQVMDNKPVAVLPSELEIGRRYELVITNAFGFYRYRLGDVIKVVGFEGQLPVYEFAYRAGQMLNVLWEKTPESSFLNAIQKSLSNLGEEHQLHEYCATENINMAEQAGSGGGGKFYIVFVELASINNSRTIRLPDNFSQQVDGNLCAFHEAYDVLRKDGLIQEMVVYQVQQGTFALLKSHVLANNSKASATQFKVPKAQRNKIYLDLLMSNSI